MGNEFTFERTKTGTESLFNEEAGLEEVYNQILKNREAPSGDILFVTSYPPRECGIASYSQNLLNAINNRLDGFFHLKVCALENSEAKYYYPEEVTSVLNTSIPSEYSRIAQEINKDLDLHTVVIQHEFDLFKTYEQHFLNFLNEIEKPKIVVFHTVIASPSEEHKIYIQSIAAACKKVVVLAKVSEQVLINEYNLVDEKIEVIPYGTYLIPPLSVKSLKEKYKLTGKSVLSTIGLLSPGKGIEYTLEELPAVVKVHPEVMFLVIGKTHPEEFKENGEKYRIMLEARVKSLKLQNHVQFLNGFFTSDILKEYFLLSDICIFSATDSNRAMSGMFSFAVSCGCSIISTPTPYAFEFLEHNAGLIYQVQNKGELSSKINLLLDNPAMRRELSDNIVRKSHSALWENSALLHGYLLNKTAGNPIPLDIKFPPVNMEFIKELTDRAGIIHSAYKGTPDLRSGYTLSDNVLALFVFCMHYKITGDNNDISYIKKYLKFVYHCYQPSGKFFNYLDFERKFTAQNYHGNLEEVQAKAIWALGYVYSMKGLLPSDMTDVAGLIIMNTLPQLENVASAKSLALIIKGLYYYYSVGESPQLLTQIRTLADKLVQKYTSNSRDDWKWFEEKFSDSAAILPGALLNTWLISGESSYKDIAKEAFGFLASKFFNNNRIEIAPDDDWMWAGAVKNYSIEQPADVAFVVVTLSKFYLMCKENEYYFKMDAAFKWFLGNNRINQMIYNPVTGSCYDGLENNSVNLHQSAESILSYTLARMVVEKYKFKGENHNHSIE